MRTSSIFMPSDAQIDRLIAAHPMATIVSAGTSGLVATPLPLMAERNPAGELTLLGHFARSNPQVAALDVNCEALVIFHGPHGYVSPSWMNDRTQAPTWNYATIHLRVAVTFDRSRDAAIAAVHALTHKMEDGRSGAGAPHELRARHDRLIAGVVEFSAQVIEVRAKFKLGQNERPDVLTDILAAVGANGNADLHALMIEHNLDRLTPHGKD